MKIKLEPKRKGETAREAWVRLNIMMGHLTEREEDVVLWALLLTNKFYVRFDARDLSRECGMLCSPVTSPSLSTLTSYPFWQPVHTVRAVF